MARGIGSATPELDKLLKPHGAYQNFAVYPDKMQAEFTTSDGKKARVPLKQVHLDEMNNRMEEQRRNVKNAKLGIGGFDE
jgi:hypothetical protein